MLVRADALREAGGIEVIRGALIDDCALAKALKAHGPIWLGLTERVRSIRRLSGVRGYSPHGGALGLCATALFAAAACWEPSSAWCSTYLVPPLLAMFGGGAARMLGLTTWALMAIAFQPTLRFYRLSPLWGVALPAIAAAIHALHPRFRLSICARTGRKLEGARASQRVGAMMITAAASCDRARAIGMRISRWRRG